MGLDTVRRVLGVPVATLLVVTLILATLVLPAVGGTPHAGAQTAEIEGLRARAGALIDDLDRLNRQVSLLDEEYNGALLEMESLQVEINKAKGRVADATAESDEIRSDVASFAIQTYTGADARSLADTSSVGNRSVRLRYAETAVGSGRDALEQLRGSRLRTEDELAVLAEAEAEAEALGVELEERRVEIEQTIGEQSQLLAGVEGDLDEAVRAEEARRERERAERAARAQAEADRRAAERARVSAARQVEVEVAGRALAATPSAAASEADNAGADQNESEAPAAASEQVAQAAPEAEPVAAAPSATGAHPSAAGAVEAAKSRLGVRYQWGGESPSTGFDCSGLVTWSYRTAAGIGVPHQSRAQYASTRRISTDEIVPGDLLFFGSPIHHVGMYVGAGQMIEAPHSGATVRYRSIGRSDMVGAGRVVG